MGPMSARMVRMLKWLSIHPVTVTQLKSANQATLRGLALRGYVNKAGITQKGSEAVAHYKNAEFVSRLAVNKDLSDGVIAALGLVRKGS